MIRIMVCEPGGRVIVQTSHIEIALHEAPENGRYILYEESEGRVVESDLLYLADGERWNT